jgi:hypothetical protein
MKKLTTLAVGALPLLFSLFAAGAKQPSAPIPRSAAGALLHVSCWHQTDSLADFAQARC